MKRALILVLPLLALGVAACGDDDDAPEVTTGVTVPDVTTADGSSPELTLPDISIPDISLPDISLPDNISIPDFSIPDISIPDLSDISIPDLSEIEDQIRSSLEGTGLSDGQIDCLIDAAGDMGGETPDLGRMTDLFEQCDIDLADLQPG